MAIYGEIVQVEPTGSSDKMWVRESSVWELAELLQEGGVEAIQPEVRGDSVQLWECQRQTHTSPGGLIRTARPRTTLATEVGGRCASPLHTPQREGRRGTS